MLKTKSVKINLRIKDSIWVDIALITKNGVNNLTYAVETSLERYFGLLEIAYKEVKKELSPNERNFLLDALGELNLDINKDLNRQLIVKAEEMMDYEHLDKKHKIDRESLINKLRSLPAHHCIAIADRVEKFWESVLQTGDNDVTGRF